MGKIIDITDKLELEESPVIVIKDKEIEVNADAATVIKVMGILGDTPEPTINDIMHMYNLLIPESGREVIDSFKLSFNDFKTVIKSAINVATGTDEEETQGE